MSQLSNTNASLEAALEAKANEAQNAAVELASLKVANEQVQTAAAAIPAIPAEVEAELTTIKQKLSEKETETSNVEAELTTIKQKLSEKEKETSRLLEENERLSEQLASSVERPAADGEEAGNVDMNGHGEAAHDAPAQKEVDEDWRDKFEVLHMEHEKM